MFSFRIAVNCMWKEAKSSRPGPERDGAWQRQSEGKESDMPEMCVKARWRSLIVVRGGGGGWWIAIPLPLRETFGSRHLWAFFFLPHKCYFSALENRNNKRKWRQRRKNKLELSFVLRPGSRLLLAPFGIKTKSAALCAIYMLISFGFVVEFAPVIGQKERGRRIKGSKDMYGQDMETGPLQSWWARRCRNATKLRHRKLT